MGYKSWQIIGWFCFFISLSWLVFYTFQFSKPFLVCFSFFNFGKLWKISSSSGINRLITALRRIVLVTFTFAFTSFAIIVIHTRTHFTGNYVNTMMLCSQPMIISSMILSSINKQNVTRWRWYDECVKSRCPRHCL